MSDTPDDLDDSPSGAQETLDDPYLVGPLRRLVPTAAARTVATPPAVAPSVRGARRSWPITAALGVALVGSWVTGIGLLIHRAMAPAPAAAPAAPAVVARAAPRFHLPAPRAAVGGFVVPRATTTVERGAVTVVDIGVDATSLTDALAEQRSAARDAGEAMLVMTTGSGCGPCEAFFDALPDPRMQTALAHVRLVRVDLRVFKDDLDSLEIPNAHYPGFFVLGPDLRPRDGIDGGEWDDDVPQNIAPVLGAFVRGTLVRRRTSWQSLPGSGMRL